MYALGHRRLISLTLAVSGLLLLTASGSAARQSNGVWRLLDGGSTDPQDQARPQPRKHSTLTYDPVGQRIILFGGDKTGGRAHSDVWEYRLPNGPWEMLFDDNATDCSSAATRPCKRHGHTATYVVGSQGGEMWIHGGRGDDGCLINDTWKFKLYDDPTPWVQLWPGGTNGPLPRWHHAMVNSGGGPRFFGGNILGSCQGGIGESMCDMWSWNFSTSSWHRGFGNPTAGGDCRCLGPGDCTLTGPELPERRYAHSMTVYDGVGVVIFGGVYALDGGAGLSNLWVGTTSLGEVPDPSLSRVFHTATYDPIGQRMIVIGGYSDGSLASSSMVSDVTSVIISGYPLSQNWSVLQPGCTGPGKLAEHAAVYDPVGDRVLTFGGVYEDGTFRNDLWALEFGQPSAGNLLVTPPCALEVVGQSGGVIDPNGVANIHVEANGVPQSGVAVELDFSQMSELVIASTQPEMGVECSSHRLQSTTDASGNARIHILGGANLLSGCPDPDPTQTSFRVYANGTFTGSYVPYRSFDLTGEKAVDGNDISEWLGIANGGIYCSAADYDGDGRIGDGDQALWFERFFAGTSAAPGGANCGGGGGASLQPAPPQVEDAPLLTGITGVRPTPTSGTVDVDIELAQPESGRPLDLKVYDVVGRLVRTLPAQGLDAGRHSIRWDTRDESGQQVKAGIYIVRLQARSIMMKRQVVVVR